MTSTSAALRARPQPGDPLDPEAAISIRGLGKRYGEFVAVDSLDLDIARGEIFALLGPNGAGKTTTVEICEGYRARDAGEVRVLGEDPAQGGRAWKARLGIVLQSNSGESQLTVREMVASRADLYADPRDPDEVLELVGLTEKARRARPVAVRWSAAPARRGARHRRPAHPALPRRADHRLRPGGAAAVLVADPVAARARHHDAAHHPLPGRGRGAGRPGRGHQPAAGWSRSPSRRCSAAGRRRPAVVSWTEDGVRRTAETATPTAFVRELAGRFPGEVPDLAVARPTLEDVYLRMIGEDAA